MQLRYLGHISAITSVVGTRVSSTGVDDVRRCEGFLDGISRRNRSMIGCGKEVERPEIYINSADRTNQPKRAGGIHWHTSATRLVND